METQISEESRSIMSTCPDVPSLGTIVDRISNSLLKPGVRQISYHLFYKAVVKGLESEIEKLKSRKDEVAKRTAEESLSRKLINHDVRLWQKDVEKIINDLEVFLEGYKEKGSRIHFKDIPFPNPLSLAHNPEDENIPVVEQSDIPTIFQDRVYTLVRGLRYLFSFKAIVNSLNNQIQSLTIVNEEVAGKVVQARYDGKIIMAHIVKWQKEVEIIRTYAYESLEQIPSRTCFKVLQFPKPLSRFRLGRKAAHLENCLFELTIVGKNLLSNEVGYIPTYEYIPFRNTPYQDFGSRQEAYGKLWQALTSQDAHPILGIYGMPGVGKTRMMEEAWKQAIGKNIFHMVTRVVLGNEEINVISLQDQLAGYLGCHLESKANEWSRAAQLKRCIMDWDKILIILDDVWEIIPLNNIGIPFDDGWSRRKILLTSRKIDVCLRYGCKDPIEIKTLDNAEACEMFKNTVGASIIESLDDVSLAEEVCKSCGALPLLIEAVGKALMFATENSWEDALFQLENGCFEDIDGIEPSVYDSIKLSFDQLENMAKTLLLLCSLFEKDDDIEIGMLIDLATGSLLVHKSRNINGLIDKLKSSSLLLEGKAYYTIKMNDIIRNVARSIAARDPRYAFQSIVCKSGLLNDADYPSRRLLQMDLRVDNVCFPDNLVCPELHTLMLQCNDHSQQNIGSFFQGFMNLRVLVIKRMSLSQHQLSIHSLDRLIVLILDGCDVHQTFLIPVSENLETLCIRECHLPSPLDLPELLNLRKLELVSGTQIVMLPNAISRLSTLEEVNIPGGFTIWEEAATSIYAELSTLTELRILITHFDDSQSCPHRGITQNLIEFNIHVGSRSYSFSPRDNLAERYSRLITLEESNINDGLMALVERADQVNLIGLEGFSDGFNYNEREGYQNLRKLRIVRCHDIFHHIPWLTFFRNLCIAEISECRGLKFLFSVAAAKCLVQLKELRISDCSTMEAIVKADGPTDGEILTFPRLRFLMLKDLPILTSFYNDKPTTDSSSLEISVISNPSISFFSEKVEFPELKKLVINNIGNKGEFWANEVVKEKYDKITTSGTEAD